MNGKDRSMVPVPAQSSEPENLRILSQRKPWALSQKPPETPPRVMAETPVKPPTKRQLECLRAIDAYIREHNHSPSIRDICDTLKCSVNNAIGFINMLERLKLINRPVGSARSITLTQSGLALLYPELRFSAEARIEELGL